MGISKANSRASFLATGSEIIQGEIQDTNSNYFAKIISQHGGNIYQHLQVSDKKSEIVDGMNYLLQKSDVLIITGGLGPTSDDTTRFALAEVVDQELIFSDEAWQHIVNRGKFFNLKMSSANRQQAYFPPGADLFVNQNGTAFGCHVNWQGKHIFMLPGPPKECRPIFETQVVPALEKLNFFSKIKLHRWVTLGLIEAEIASDIDALALKHPVETAYRWHYPYLDIKIVTDSNNDVCDLLDKIEKRLKDHIVSFEDKDAYQALNDFLLNKDVNVQIIDNATEGAFVGELKLEKLKLISSMPQQANLLFLLNSTQTPTKSSFHLRCEGYHRNKLVFEHNLIISNRGSEAAEYIKHYAAWQLRRFLANI